MLSALLILAATAAAAPSATYDFSLTERARGVTTGLGIHVTYGEPDEKAPGLDALAFALPRGLRVDTAAVARCGASDDELRAGGLGACPADSEVGQGRLVATTGFPGVDPLEFDVHVLNADGQLIEAVTMPDTSVVVATDRLTVEDGRLVAHPPAPPGGPPDNRTTVREVDVDIEALDGYITTPRRCPRAKRWRSTVIARFAGYDRPVRVTDSTPCRRRHR